MKANELRIGNWIKYEDKLVQVVQLSSLMILCKRDENQFLVNCAPKEFQPIELTEEVLVKIGFVKENGVNRMYNKRCVVSYYIGNFYKELVIEVRRENGFYKNNMVHYDIKYLHELQNAYNLLTNEELEVEL
jgi:hypothetical protein